MVRSTLMFILMYLAHNIAQAGSATTSSDSHARLQPIVSSLISEYEKNAALSRCFESKYIEIRERKSKFKTKDNTVSDVGETEQEIHVEETRCGDSFLAIRKRVKIIAGGVEQPYREDRVTKGDKYIFEFRPPSQFANAWLIPNESLGADYRDKTLRAARIPYSPTRYGFGDGDALLPELLRYGMECRKFSCEPLPNPDGVYAVTIEDGALRRELQVDASKGCLIIKSLVFVNDEKKREITVRPKQYEEAWFPAEWNEVNTSAGSITSSAYCTLQNIKFISRQTPFTVNDILQNEDVPVAIQTESGTAIMMRVIDGKLVTPDTYEKIVADKKRQVHEEKTTESEPANKEKEL